MADQNTDMQQPRQGWGFALGLAVVALLIGLLAYLVAQGGRQTAQGDAALPVAAEAVGAVEGASEDVAATEAEAAEREAATAEATPAEEVPAAEAEGDAPVEAAAEETPAAEVTTAEAEGDAPAEEAAAEPADAPTDEQVETAEAADTAEPAAAEATEAAEASTGAAATEVAAEPVPQAQEGEVADAGAPDVQQAEIAEAEETPVKDVTAADTSAADGDVAESTDAVEGAPLEVAAATPDPGTARAPETGDQTAPAAPRFDLVRIDETGAGLVAGRGAPGSVVRVMSGGTELATAEVQASGEFVAFIQTPASDEGQTLSLIALNGGSEQASEQEFLVLPVADTDQQPVAPAIVVQDDDNVRVVQPSGLGKVDGVTLDSISYDETGAVRLAGRAPGALPIRIYVDGAPTGAAQAAEDGTWSTRIEGIVEGRYVLRVDALNTDGSVSSRAESPFQRVFPTAEQRANPTEITVQPGNTLWVMARERYGQGVLYTQIFAANQDAIRDPDLIYPGQIFTIPEEADFVQQ